MPRELSSEDFEGVRARIGHAATALYAEFQRKVQSELPRIPLIFNEQRLVSSTRLRDFWTGAYATLGNFADAYLAAG